jgi:hypothetical protein
MGVDEVSLCRVGDFLDILLRYIYLFLAKMTVAMNPAHCFDQGQCRERSRGGGNGSVPCYMQSRSSTRFSLCEYHITGIFSVRMGILIR